jgi:hypothetical protein
MLDARLRKRPKTRVDAVHRRRRITSVHDRIDSSTSRLNARSRLRTKRYATTTTSHVLKVAKRHGTTEFHRRVCLHERNASRQHRRRRTAFRGRLQSPILPPADATFVVHARARARRLWCVITSPTCPLSTQRRCGERSRKRPSEQACTRADRPSTGANHFCTGANHFWTDLWLPTARARVERGRLFQRHRLRSEHALSRPSLRCRQQSRTSHARYRVLAQHRLLERRRKPLLVLPGTLRARPQKPLISPCVTSSSSPPAAKFPST